MAEEVKRKLGQLLVESGNLSPQSLEEALTHQKNHGGLIGQILISLGYISEEDLVAALAWQLRIPYLPLGNYAINMDAMQTLGEDFCRRHAMVAFDMDDEFVYAALSDPLNEITVEELEKKCKLVPQVFLSTATEIHNMLDVAFSSSSNTKND